MGAPIFTEAELRRAMRVAGEFGCTVKICPRERSLTLVPLEDEPITSTETGGKSCDDIFGGASG